MTIRIERLLEDMQRQNRELEKRIESLETAEYNRHNKLLLLDGITPPGESSGWGTLYIDGSDGELKVVFGDSEIDQLSGLETVTGGDSHDHSGGDGAVIPESGLAAAVIAKLVTNGDSHDHVGGDGAAIAGIVTNGNSHDHSGGDGAAIPESGLASAVTAQLVTNGDSHNHVGGDGGAIGAGGLADGAVDTTARLANNIVDDTKVGDRVPQFYRRKGGSSSDWDTGGTTNYTPTTVRMQVGSDAWSGSAASSGNKSITFPTSFSNNPIVFVGIRNAAPSGFSIGAANVSSSGFTFYWADDVSTRTSVGFAWFAVGPE